MLFVAIPLSIPNLSRKNELTSVEDGVIRVARAVGTVAWFGALCCSCTSDTDAVPPPGQPGADGRPGQAANVPAGTASTGEAGPADWNIAVNWIVGGPNAAGPAVFGAFDLLLSVGPEGLVYVVDVSSREVRVFDETGQFVRQFGREGQGPGEFSSPSAIGFDTQGRFWVRDQTRYSIFDGAGGLLETIPRDLFHAGYQHITFDAAGWIVEERNMRPGNTKIVRGRPDVEGYVGTPGIGFVRMDISGEAMDTLPPIVGPVFDRRESARVPPVLTDASVISGGNMATLGLRDLQSFVPDVILRMGGDSIWFAHSNGRQIHLRTLAGDTIRHYEVTRTPPPLSRDERSLIAERLGPVERRTNEWAYGRQVIRALVPVGDQNLLALIEEEPGKPSSLFEVYGASGRPIGTLRLNVPIDWRSGIAVWGNTLVAVTLDELDVKYVFHATVPDLPLE